jgi:drug/metabolite transporter (DMT)-like permease
MRLKTSPTYETPSVEQTVTPVSTVNPTGPSTLPADATRPAVTTLPANSTVPTGDATADTTVGSRSRPNRGLSTAWTAELCLWFTAIAWGANLLVVKSALGTLNPWVFNTSRLTLATLMLGLLAWMEVRWRPTAPTRIQWTPFLCFAFLNGFLYQVFFFLGISQTTAGNTALLLSSMPMWTAAFSFLFIRERLPLLTWAGLLVTFGGTLFVLLQNTTIDLSGSYLVGNAFILCGAMTWAAATVVSRPLLQSMSPLRLAFLSSLITMPLHFVLCGPFLSEAWPQLTQPGSLAAIIYSGSISTGIAYATWHYGVRHLGGSRAGVYQNVVTLVAVAGGWLFLREAMLWQQLAGGLAILVGVILMKIKR